MRSFLHPKLINGPFDDPGLFIPLFFENRALMFDLGDISPLSPRDILKTSHAFVTHTHMDHFAGFDRMLRLFLGRDKELHLYGPEGFLKNIEGKLAGYTWNLVDNFKYCFSIRATEVHPDHLLVNSYFCHDKFLPAHAPEKTAFSGKLLEEPALTVSAVILDHNLPCLGFSIKERFHINIIKEQLERLGLETGPWLRQFKQALYDHYDPDSEFEVICKKKDTARKFVLGELARQIALITPGQKVSYIADVVYSKSNAEKIIALVKNSDHLFIETAFLEKHRDTALQKHHLTAAQAGTLAGQAGVKQLTPFHFSPRYIGQEDLLYSEVMAALKKTL
ncbi:MAG: ribonuclease Z [Deltaproteobacteria bacterium]|nr:MAG: ribonuclease Z [Deltaproteobacteria bacterium]